MKDGNSGSSNNATPGQDSDVLTGTFTVGRYAGLTAQVAVERTPPGAPAPDEFAVTLFVPNARGENVEVARVDTAHSGCHVDRLYLP